MPRISPIAALLLVAACSQPAEQNAAASNQVAEAPAETESATPLLEGQWRVTKVDGKPLDAGSVMGASFAGGRMTVAAGCSRRAWSFTQQRNIVSFAPDPSGSSNCATPPNSPQESAFHAFDKATMAIFDPDGREANLSGTGGNVTLERSRDR